MIAPLGSVTTPEIVPVGAAAAPTDTNSRITKSTRIHPIDRVRCAILVSSLKSRLEWSLRTSLSEECKSLAPRKQNRVPSPTFLVTRGRIDFMLILQGDTRGVAYY